MSANEGGRGRLIQKFGKYLDAVVDEVTSKQSTKPTKQEEHSLYNIFNIEKV